MKTFLALALSFALLQGFFIGAQERSVAKKILIPPPQNLELLSFGYRDLIASLLWVRLLQDILICDQEGAENYRGQPALVDSEDTVGEILRRDLGRSRCEKGWAYQMLESITDLQVDFHAAYLDGATMLSVIVDDRLGAQQIFQKGIQAFPDDWHLLYHAAYHELFEVQNAETAADLLRRAGERGAPDWVYALSAKLYTRLGQAAFAKSILETVLAREPNAETIDRVKLQLEKINQTILEETSGGSSSESENGTK